MTTPVPPRFDVPRLIPESERRARGRRRPGEPRRRRPDPALIIPEATTEEEAIARIRDHTADQLAVSWRLTNPCDLVACPGCDAAEEVVRIAKHGFDLGQCHNRLVNALGAVRGMAPVDRAHVADLLIRQHRALAELAFTCNAFEEHMTERLATYPSPSPGDGSEPS